MNKAASDLRPAPPVTSRRQVAFLGHEIAEYLIGAALVATGIHLSGTAEIVLVLAGVALVVLGILTDAPLGAVALLTRRAHHVADLILIGALALSPLLTVRHGGLVAALVAEAVALVLLRIERSTRYLDARRRVPTSRDAGLGSSASRLTRTGAHRLGVATGIARRAARAYAEQRRSAS